MTTLYYRLAENTLRAAATGSDVPKLVATLRSTFSFDVAFVTSAGLVAPLVAPEAGSVSVRAVIKLAPESSVILLDTSLASNAEAGTARRYTAAWTAEECDSAPFRAAVLGKATVAATLEIEVTHTSGTARAVTPVTLVNANFQPTDAAPDPGEDASWEWLKLRAPEANGFIHDDDLKTLEVDATPAIADVTGLQAALDAKAATSHTHAIADTTGLQAALDAKAPLASPAFTGVPTVPTAASATSTTQAASTAFVQQELAALLDGAPGALNTLNELAAALGDDANFASSVTTALSGKAATSHTHAIADVTGLQAALDAKLALAGGTMTGALGITAGSLLTASLSLSQTWNNIGTTCRGIEFAATNTNSAADSTLLRLLTGAAGTTQAMALSALYGSLSVGASNNNATITLQGSDRAAVARLGAFGAEFALANLQLAATNAMLRFSDTNTSVRYATLYGEAEGVLALRDGSANTTGSAWELLEMTAPGTPAANRLRLYVEDNGSGKTRLVVKFSDASTAVLATQP